MTSWKLKRVNQCEKCPWRKDVDPYDIPNGYSEDRHRALSATIAQPGEMRGTGIVMSCHEHDSADQVHCVGWLMHQLGRGNNIGLRLQVLSCENIGAVRTHGPQHERSRTQYQLAVVAAAPPSRRRAEGWQN